MNRMVLMACLVLGCGILMGNSWQEKAKTWYIENEQGIGKVEPGPHEGGGSTVGTKFFSTVPDLKLNFKKRVLKPGSAIGWHTQSNDRAYYVVSGMGLMQMPAETVAVKPGDAILTRSGGWHALKQTGSEDLVLLIAYQ